MRCRNNLDQQTQSSRREREKAQALQARHDDLRFRTCLGRECMSEISVLGRQMPGACQAASLTLAGCKPIKRPQFFWVLYPSPALLLPIGFSVQPLLAVLELALNSLILSKKQKKPERLRCYGLEVKCLPKVHAFGPPLEILSQEGTEPWEHGPSSVTRSGSAFCVLFLTTTH